MADTYEYFLKAFRHVLATSGITQRDIAEQASSAPQTINAIARGRARAGQAKQEQIARICGYSFLDFVGLGKRLSEAPEGSADHHTPITPSRHGAPPPPTEEEPLADATFLAFAENIRANPTGRAALDTIVKAMHHCLAEGGAMGGDMEGYIRELRDQLEQERIRNDRNVAELKQYIHDMLSPRS